MESYIASVNDLDALFVKLSFYFKDKDRIIYFSDKIDELVKKIIIKNCNTYRQYNFEMSDYNKSGSDILEKYANKLNVCNMSTCDLTLMLIGNISQDEFDNVIKGFFVSINFGLEKMRHGINSKEFKGD